LFSSHLTTWRRQREEAEAAAFAPKKRGPKALVPDRRDAALARLEKENTQLKKRLQKTELMLDLQKKSRSCGE
jgi:hypothetical protein